MTLSTSAVAVCCCRDSLRSSVRWRTSSNSRTFSIAITAWSAKVVTRSICFCVNGSHALSGENDNADRFVLAQQRHAERSALTGQRDRFAHRVFGIGGDVGDLHRVAFERDAAGDRASVDRDRVLLEEFDILVAEADGSAGAVHVAFAAQDERHLGIAQKRRGVDQRIQHRLQVEG